MAGQARQGAERCQRGEGRDGGRMVGERSIKHVVVFQSYKEHSLISNERRQEEELYPVVLHLRSHW